MAERISDGGIILPEGMITPSKGLVEPSEGVISLDNEPGHYGVITLGETALYDSKGAPLPARTELTVIPGAIKEKDKVGWSFVAYSGCEIHRQSDYTAGCDIDALPAIKDKLKAGEKVLVNIMGTWCRGTVEQGTESYFYVDTGGSICPLEFDQDDRHCWTCASAFNVYALSRTEGLEIIPPSKVE